jgi:hypothetical protein
VLTSNPRAWETSETSQETPQHPRKQPGLCRALCPAWVRNGYPSLQRKKQPSCIQGRVVCVGGYRRNSQRLGGLRVEGDCFFIFVQQRSFLKVIALLKGGVWPCTEVCQGFFISRPGHIQEHVATNRHEPPKQHEPLLLQEGAFTCMYGIFWINRSRCTNQKNNP